QAYPAAPPVRAIDARIDGLDGAGMEAPIPAFANGLLLVVHVEAERMRRLARHGLFACDFPELVRRPAITGQKVDLVDADPGGSHGKLKPVGDHGGFVARMGEFADVLADAEHLVLA